MTAPQTAPKLDRSNIVEFIADIFERRGAESYLGEKVSMSEHMLQGAALAEAEGASEELVAAALLHDIGHAVSPQRHHKHTLYLVQNADIAGFSDQERQLVALVARYHRRSPPERGRPDLEGLPAADLRLVRRLVALLRVADALDRSHHQPVLELRAAVRGPAARVVARTRAPVDLELWDVAREAAWFRAVLGRRLEVVPARR